MRRWLENAPLHPFLLAGYPAFALLATNLGQVRPGIAARALALSLAAAGAALLLLRWVMREWQRPALLVSWGLLLFYSYGHLYNALRPILFMGTHLGRHRFLLPVGAALALAGSWWILRRPVAPSWLTGALNLGLAAAILLPLGRILVNSAGSAFASREGGAAESAAGDLRLAESGPLPDIYFVILDAYAREDTLRERFEFDNRPFLDALEGMGFNVAGCAQSNYSQTELSLAATLNMQYLTDMIDERVQDEAGRAQLWPLIRHSRVRRLLEGLGYRTVAFETGYYWTEWEDADVYLAPDRGLLQGMSAFEATLLRSTAAWALIDALPVLPAFLQRDLDRSTDAHRERLLYDFDQLETMSEIPGPKFVFAHIVSPHRPFVFGADGNPVDDDYTWTRSDLGLEAYREGYRQQLTYLNRRMERIFRTIVDEAAGRVVIIVQGDHGPEEGSSQDRMRILSASYLAGHEVDTAHPALSPVNTFRYALSSLFGADLPLVEDVSYFSTYDSPFDYNIISGECAGESDP